MCGWERKKKETNGKNKIALSTAASPPFVTPCVRPFQFAAPNVWVKGLKKKRERKKKKERNKVRKKLKKKKQECMSVRVCAGECVCSSFVSVFYDTCVGREKDLCVGVCVDIATHKFFSQNHRPLLQKRHIKETIFCKRDL